MTSLQSGEPNFSFFLDQTPTWVRPTRRRRTLESLPDDLKYSFINPKLTASGQQQKDAGGKDGDKPESKWAIDKQKYYKKGTPIRSAVQRMFTEKNPATVDSRLKSTERLPLSTQVSQLLSSNLDLTDSEREVEARKLYIQLERGENELAYSSWFESLSFFEQLGVLLEQFHGRMVRLPRILRQQLLFSYEDLKSNYIVENREWQLDTSAHDYFKVKQKQSVKEEELKLVKLEKLKAKTEVKSGGKNGTHAGKSKSAKLVAQPHVEREKEKEKDKPTTDDDPNGTKEVKDTKENEHPYPSASHVTESVKPDDSESLTGQPGGRRRTINTKVAFHPAATDSHSDLESLDDKAYISKEGFYAIVNFQLSNKRFERLGWLTTQPIPETKQSQSKFLQFLISKLRESMTKKTEQEELNKNRFADKVFAIIYVDDKKIDIVDRFKVHGTRPSPSKVLTLRRSGKLDSLPMPSIPDEEVDFDQHKKLLELKFNDGTSQAYYPSGQVAVQTVSGNPTNTMFYTYLYDDTPEKKLIANFTPTGHGFAVCTTCNASLVIGNGKLYYYTSPDQKKAASIFAFTHSSPVLQSPITLKMNKWAELRISHISSMILLLSKTSDFVAGDRGKLRYNVSGIAGEENPKISDLGTLLVDIEYCSHSAFEHTRPEIKSESKDLAELAKSKTKKKTKESKSPNRASLMFATEKPAIPGTSLPDRPSKTNLLSVEPEPQPQSTADALSAAAAASTAAVAAAAAEPELIAFTMTEEDIMDGFKTFHDRIKILCLNWLRFYQSLLGLGQVDSETFLYIGLTSRRTVSETRDRPTQLVDKLLNASKFLRTIRSGRLKMLKIRKLGSLSESNIPAKVTPESLFTDFNAPHTISWDDPHARLSLESPSDPVPNVDDGDWVRQCPPSLRDKILGNHTVGCRCRRTQIPRITDVEFDTFIRNYAPRTQLIVVAVKSSRYSDPLLNPLMLERIYEEKAGSRSGPCPMSMGDPFRILWYDVDLASVDTDREAPLLQTRHHVVPGVVLIYCNGRLVFCDYIFNGYGCAEEDFRKQLRTSRKTAVDRQYLPFDFKFKLQKGHHGLRSSWGGEIGGVYFKIQENSIEFQDSKSSIDLPAASLVPPIASSDSFSRQTSTLNATPRGSPDTNLLQVTSPSSQRKSIVTPPSSARKSIITPPSSARKSIITPPSSARKSPAPLAPIPAKLDMNEDHQIFIHTGRPAGFIRPHSTKEDKKDKKKNKHRPSTGVTLSFQ